MRGYSYLIPSGLSNTIKVTNLSLAKYRTKGSHRISQRDKERVVIPFPAGKILHPKIVKQVLTACEG